MTETYGSMRQALVHAVTASPGSLSPAVRSYIVERARGVAFTGSVPDTMDELVATVARDATGVDDAMLAAVHAEGFDEEAIFEAVVCAALGASLARLDRVDVLLPPGA
jgi:hypothetical protein